MPRMNLKTKIMGISSHFRHRGQFVVTGFKITLCKRIAISACVQLDHLSANAVRAIDLLFVCRNKDRHPRSGLTQGRNEMGQFLFVLRNVQPALGCAFFAFFGNQTNGMGLVTQSNSLHFVRSGHLEVQRDAKSVHQCVNISVSNVTTIFAQMRRDPISTRLLRDKGGAHGIGQSATPCITQSCHMIDVDA